jgi:opacity protein-like surface antigen
MKTKLTLLASTTLAMLAATAPAQAGSSWYVSLAGGANWMTDESFFASNGTDTLTFTPDSDAGWLISGAVGFSLEGVVKGLRAEAEVAYRQHQVDGVWASTDGGESDGGALDYDHSTLSVMANVWYDFAVADVSPYVGGGIGWADSDLDGRYVGGNVPAISVSDSGFAWQLGAGINFDIAPSMKLGVGYRYLEGPDVRIGAPNVLNSVGGDVESQNHAAVVSLTFGM